MGYITEVITLMGYINGIRAVAMVASVHQQAMCGCWVSLNYKIMYTDQWLIVNFLLMLISQDIARSDIMKQKVSRRILQSLLKLKVSN